MRHLHLFIAALALPALGTLAIAAPQRATTIQAAVAASDRSPDNVKLDPSRKPAEVLAFLGLKPGAKVVDLVGGNLYWAEIEAAVVGPKGHVTIWQPAQFLKDEGRKKLDAFTAAHANTSWLSSPFESPQLPANSYDFALINLDYHDVYWQSAKFGIPRQDPAKWLKAVNSAMKRGAIVGVVDHVARAGTDPREMAEKYHRIDPAVIRRDFARAGFTLVGQSPILRNPADSRDLLVFDAKIRGKTDRVLMKFRKTR